jgi:hypothetical protein
MHGYQLDPETRVADERFAVVYAPRRARDRVAETNVTVVDSEAVARGAANPAGHRYAARVIGPARSSEGLRLYYIVDWLD